MNELAPTSLRGPGERTPPLTVAAGPRMDATTTYGTGLRGMADRLEAVGGSLTVTSDPGSGTAIRGEVPVATRSSLSR